MCHAKKEAGLVYFWLYSALINLIIPYPFVDLIVLPIQYFTERTPGTYIEKKESSLTWHYRDADPNFGSWQAKDMQIQLEDVLSNLPLEIIQGNRMVEVSKLRERSR